MPSALASPTFLVSCLRVFVVSALVGVAPTIVQAQPVPQPTERVTFDEAVERAVKNNTSTAIAAAGILRAEGLLQQARAATNFQLGANVTVTTLNRVVEFDGLTVVPRTQVNAGIAAQMPILAAADWARRNQAQDQVQVSQFNAADVRRQVSLSAADAYLSVIAQRRILEAQIRARDTAKAHFDLAAELEQRGSGSHLNSLRAEQQLSTDAGLMEVAELSLYRAQEALGVVMVAGVPVDAVEEPTFPLSTEDLQGAPSRLLQLRTDLKLFASEQSAAERVLRDSSKDWWPTVDAIFQPQTTRPTSIFSPSTTWQLLFRSNIPIFDSGQRASLKVQRQAAVDVARATLQGATTEAESEVRAARAAVGSSERALASARAAAEQAGQVVTITNVAFRAGAATNIEVIDAERSARDLETAVARAEDTLRRARLELLEALGRFPQP